MGNRIFQKADVARQHKILEGPHGWATCATFQY